MKAIISVLLGIASYIATMVVFVAFIKYNLMFASLIWHKLP